MKLIRFMSRAEAMALLEGRTIENTTVHHDTGNATDSVGFCFIKVDQRRKDPILHTSRYMSGIANMEACLVAETPSVDWHKGWGMYADYDVPHQELWPRKKRVEYSTTKYSLGDFQKWAVYKASGPAWAGSAVWHEPKLIRELQKPALMDDYMRDMFGAGQMFIPANLPDDLQYGEPGTCFDTCLLAALKSKGKYRYCEGMAILRGKASVHAWLTDVTGTYAYDPTWRAEHKVTKKNQPIPGIAYKGVILDTITAASYVIGTGNAGIIPNRHLAPEKYNKVLERSELHGPQ